MKNNKWNLFVYLHGFLFLWAALFIGSLLISAVDIAAALAIGNALFLFVNIPLSVATLILKKKDFFDIEYEDTIGILSILNLLVGIAEWVLVIMLAQSPKFG